MSWRDDPQESDPNECPGCGDSGDGCEICLADGRFDREPDAPWHDLDRDAWMGEARAFH